MLQILLYYLLWVGAPERMPFEVIREIDSDYCVGLLDLETPDDYARYVSSVIAYETAAVASGHEVVFFGTRHPFDDATMLSADWLIGPLTDGDSTLLKPPIGHIRCLMPPYSCSISKRVALEDSRERDPKAPMQKCLVEFLSVGLHNRLYDGCIAGATTNIPGDSLPDLVSAGVGRFL